MFSTSCDFAISQSAVPALAGCHPTPIACMKWRPRNARNSFDSYCTLWAGVGKIVHCMMWIGRATLAGLRCRFFFLSASASLRSRNRRLPGRPGVQFTIAMENTFHTIYLRSSSDLRVIHLGEKGPGVQELTLGGDYGEHLRLSKSAQGLWEGSTVNFHPGELLGKLPDCRFCFYRYFSMV